jgi:hypothetical protein
MEESFHDISGGKCLEGNDLETRARVGGVSPGGVIWLRKETGARAQREPGAAVKRAKVCSTLGSRKYCSKW